MNNIYKSYYTKNTFITSYMTNMLNLTNDDLVLEPCGGDGDFIDALLEKNPEVRVDTVDLDDNSINILNEKYVDFSNINIRKTDTLLDNVFDTYSISGHYDKIIGNPPYGGWQDYEKRYALKKKYNGFYVKETYSLFLLRCLSLLKQNGILSFIIPDTFLYLHNHKELRKLLLSTTTIKEILIFPSKLFPGVSFGYSKLCIITIQKTQKVTNKIKIYQNLIQDSDFELIMKETNLSKFSMITIDQESIKNNDNYTFYLNKDVEKIMSSTTYQLNDIAECVTGIYTGDNKSYLYTKDHTVKGSKNYNTAEKNMVDFNCTSLSGVSSEYKFVPIVKGNSEVPFIRKEDNWFIDWSSDSINFYNNNKKSRFQNSYYYFKKGIAVPMVKSSKIRATIFEKKVFDQSVVGVFPKEEKHYLFILGLLNSNIVRDLLFNINPTANNSANYIKRIPIIIPSEYELISINKVVTTLIDDPTNQTLQKKLDDFFLLLYSKNIKTSNL